MIDWVMFDWENSFDLADLLYTYEFIGDGFGLVYSGYEGKEEELGDWSGGK